MITCKRSAYVRIIALLLALSLAAPCYASAAVIEPVQPMGSDYFDSYSAYVCAMGGGKIEIWFTVSATRSMDKLGALTIMLYESANQEEWTRVKTYTYENYPSMLVQGTILHTYGVPYYGIAGRYYKAHVFFYASKDGTSDSRGITTAVQMG